jgi:hypothetical protein
MGTSLLRVGTGRVLPVSLSSTIVVPPSQEGEGWGILEAYRWGLLHAR